MVNTAFTVTLLSQPSINFSLYPDGLKDATKLESLPT